MFSYYGSKSKIVQYYPRPTTLKIREPFCGSARYSERYWDTPDILLMDKYQVIVDVWHYLQRASQQDILGLPKFKKGECFKDCKQMSEVEIKFYGFISQAGSTGERYTVGTMNGVNTERDLKNIASNLYKIKHWKIVQGDYKDLENENATWFIDPPYQFGGHEYKESNKNLDFNSLANWCKSRNGQVIVCENTKATWMDFKPVIQMQGSMFKTTEAIWTNFKTQYDSIQQDLFGRGEEKISA